MSTTPVNSEQTNVGLNSLEKSPITVSSGSLCSPKSTDSKKSPSDSANRRKRKPKKVPNSESNFSDVEMTDISPPNLNPAINAIASKETKTDSDDCETIDKIAQMVSNFTSSPPPPPPPASVPSKPTSPSLPLVTPLSVVAAAAVAPQQQQPPLPPSIQEVENRLEEMFSDPKAPLSINSDGSAAVLSTSKVDEQQEQLLPKPKAKRGRRKQQADGNGKRQRKSAIVNGKGSKKDKLAAMGKKSGKDEQVATKKKGRKSKESGGKAKVKVDVAPYLQIQNDGSFNIINQTVNGEEDGEKPAAKPKKPVTIEKHKNIRGLYVSTLSNKYDVQQRDASWMCVFCKIGPHKHKLGDLFGPYIVSKDSKEYSLCLEDPASDVFRQSNRNKFAPITSPSSTAATNKKKRKISESARKLASPTTSTAAVNGPDAGEEVFTGMTQIDEQRYEIWFHEDCLIWSPGTHIIGAKIIGLEQAVWQSTRYRCTYCQKNGAMISCLTRGCQREAHVMCARKNWKLCDDFKTYCEQHSSIE